MGKQRDARMRRRGSIIEVSPSSKQVSRGAVPYTLYDTALTDFAYGNFSRNRRKPGRPELGDFFGDVMSAVVGKENWDARPDWMKKVVIKPDPAKIFNTAVKSVPPPFVGNVVREGQKYGVNIFYNTPAGQMPVTPETAESVYGNFPTFLKTQEVFSSIPWWVYAVGGGGILLAIMMKK